MKHIIKKILSEIRINPTDIGIEMGLFVKGNNFTLYNPIENKVYGHIGISKLSSGNYYVSGVAAEYGYDPLIYELVMGYIYPNGLLPTRDGDVRGGAINIWNRFLKRKDVKKKSLTKKDSDFSWEVYEDFGDDPDFKFVQTIYYYNGINDVLVKLLKSGEKYLSNGLDIDVVDEMGDEYWLSRYE